MICAFCLVIGVCNLGEALANLSDDVDVEGEVDPSTDSKFREGDGAESKKSAAEEEDEEARGAVDFEEERDCDAVGADANAAEEAAGAGAARALPPAAEPGVVAVPAVG